VTRTTLDVSGLPFSEHNAARPFIEKRTSTVNVVLFFPRDMCVTVNGPLAHSTDHFDRFLPNDHGDR
jgi:hypothetical protein